MAELGPEFEAAAKEALLDDVEHELVGKQGSLAHQFVQDMMDNFREFAEANDYDLGGMLENIRLADVERDRSSVSARIEVDGILVLWEFGVPPHTIRGDPLHFYWEAKDQWVKTDEVQWGSETGGIPEARALRNALQAWRAHLQQRGPGGRFR